MPYDTLHVIATADAAKRAATAKARRRARRGGHWHVLVGLRGCYMPDTNNVHATRRDAEADALYCAQEERDAVADYEPADRRRERVQGSARAGWYTLGEHRCIEITHCTMADCMDGGES